MAVRLLILGTEARYDHIRSEIPNDPHHISENFVVIPDPQRLISRLGKTEIDRSGKELLSVIDASRIDQLFRSNNTEPLPQFRTEQVLAAVSARDREVSGVVERTVRP